MFRATPIIYFLGGIVTTGLSGVNITCAANEILTFSPPLNTPCGDDLAEYMQFAGGTLLNSEAVKDCLFCPVADTDTLLASLGIFFNHRWRDLGITFAFSGFNVLASMALYWILRVPRKSRI